MNAIAQFNQLGGRTVTRQTLINLQQLALQEEIQEVAFRIGEILNKYPSGTVFDLEVKTPAYHIGLGAAQLEKVEINEVKEGYEFILNDETIATINELGEIFFSTGIPADLKNTLSNFVLGSLGSVYQSTMDTFDLEENQSDLGLGKAVTANEIYDTINKLITNTIKKVGNLPWQKEWKGSGNDSVKNYVSKKPYTGVNWLLNVEVAYDENGQPYLIPATFIQPYFLTFNQIKAAKATLKKGAKARNVIYYTQLRVFNDGNLEIKTPDREVWETFVTSNSLTPESVKENGSVIPIVKYYNVFKADDCEGLKFPAVVQKEVNPIDSAQGIIDNYPDPPKFTFLGDEAAYFPKLDKINMPKIEAFTQESFYYSTFFHELIHSTGHSKRLNRGNDTRVRDKSVADKKAYAYEELVAEMGAVFLCSEAGILFHTLENSAKYLRGWNANLVALLETDNRAFFKASAAAQKGANLILDKNESDVPKYLQGKTPPKTETKKEAKTTKSVTIRKNSKEFEKVINWKVFTEYSLKNKFSGKEITNGLPNIHKKKAKITKENDVYKISINPNLWYTAVEFAAQPKPKKAASNYGKKKAFVKKKIGNTTKETFDTKPIGELGTGKKVYFKSEKHRVNEYTNGNVVLNIGEKDSEFPIANIEFKDIDEAVFIAKEIQKAYPDGVPSALHINKYVLQLQKKYKNTDTTKKPALPSKKPDSNYGKKKAFVKKQKTAVVTNKGNQQETKIATAKKTNNEIWQKYSEEKLFELIKKYGKFSESKIQTNKDGIDYKFEYYTVENPDRNLQKYFIGTVQKNTGGKINRNFQFNENQFFFNYAELKGEKNGKIEVKTLVKLLKKNNTKPDSNVQTLELNKITLDQKRFQNRSKLNEDIVNNIVNNFSETELDPFILWNNKGKNYLLAGHHRYEGLSRLKRKTAPVKFFTGTEAEAIEFAKVKSNSNRSLETPIERAKIYREMNGTKKAIEDKAREIEGKNAPYILNLSALNPNGILIESLQKLSSGDKQNASLLEKIADWIGEVRRAYSGLTNSHEKEMFDFLMNKEDSKRINTKAEFKQKIYSIAGNMYFQESDTLNLKQFKYQTEGEKVYNDEFNELKNKVSEKVQQKADLLDRLSNVKRADFIPENDNASAIAAKKLSEMNAEIVRLQAQLIELSTNKRMYTSAGQNQAALFGTVLKDVPIILRGIETTKPKPTPQKAQNSLMNMEFDSLAMDEGWEKLLQDPARNMKIAIWGKPKNGKTSGALQLANYLTKFGSVLYNFVDQGFNKSTKDLWINSGLADKPNATPSDITSSKDLERELKKGKFTFCFIDMISDWIRNEKMKPEEFKERFIRQFPEVSFILIFEVTKSGDFKGDQGWTHLVDAIMTVEDFIIENRGRYGMGEKCVWDEGAKKFNPKRYAELFGDSESIEEEENSFSEEIEVV